MLLVLAVIVPALGLIFYHRMEDKNADRLQALYDARRLARNVSSLYEHTIMEIRHILFTLSQMPQFHAQDSAACSKIFADLLKQTENFSGFAAAKPSGEVFASAPPITKPVSFSNLSWFQRVLQTRGFTIGEYSLGRIGDKPTIVLGYPALDDTAQLTTVFAAGLDLERLQRMLLGVSLPDGAILIVIDSDGTIILHFPDLEKFVGNRMSDKIIVQTVLTQKDGVMEEVGLDRVPRLYGYTTVGSGIEAIHIIVGIPAQVAYADLKRNTIRDFTLLGLVSALALLGAWLFGKIFIISPVNRLLDATKQLAGGDLTVRVNRSANTGELGLLALHFDKMAGALQRREEERKLATEALRENEEKYRLHFENISDMIFSYDQEFRILSVSPSLERMLGYKPEEFIGKSLAELNIISRDDLQRVFSDATQVFAGKNIDSTTHEFVTGDGARKYGELSSAPLFRDGRVVAVVSVVRDVTARKCAEESLRLSEGKYRALTESLADLIYRADPETFAATYVNKAVERIYGYSVDEWLRDSSLREKAIHPEDRERVLAFYGKAQKAVHDGIAEYRIIRRDGEMRWISDRFAWEKGTCGKVVSFNGIMSDITEHRQAEQALRQQREELSRFGRLATVGEFAASVAHEINQPLTAILNNAQAAKRILSSDTPDIDEVSACLQDIIDDDQRAVEVIRHLRSFLKRQDAYRTIDINTVIEEVLKILYREIVDRQVRVTSYLSPDIPHIEGRRIELQQVLMNLILNGCDALMNLDPQRRQMHIRTSVDEPNSIVVAVQDSGTGLDKIEIDRVFEPYYTTKIEGLGVGLSISKSIIAAHGGRIWAVNNHEGGATFYFTLPISKEKAVSS